jgi:hypothetical protein
VLRGRETRHRWVNLQFIRSSCYQGKEREKEKKGFHDAGAK